MNIARTRITALIGPQEPAAKAMGYAAVAILALHWAVVIAFLAARAGSLGFLRLHYTAALGVDWVAEWWYLFIYPVLGCASLLVNVWLSGVLARRHPPLGILVLGATLAVEVLLAAGALFAVLLNS
jgi:hypothetical protein